MIIFINFNFCNTNGRLFLFFLKNFINELIVIFLFVILTFIILNLYKKPFELKYNLFFYNKNI